MLLDRLQHQEEERLGGGHDAARGELALGLKQEENEGLTTPPGPCRLSCVPVRSGKDCDRLLPQPGTTPRQARVPFRFAAAVCLGPRQRCAEPAAHKRKRRRPQRRPSPPAWIDDDAPPRGQSRRLPSVLESRGELSRPDERTFVDDSRDQDHPVLSPFTSSATFLPPSSSRFSASSRMLPTSPRILRPATCILLLILSPSLTRSSAHEFLLVR